MRDHPPGSAIALALAIIALPLAMVPPGGAVVSLAALIVASFARRRLRQFPDLYRESAMPSAATVCALVALGLALCWFLGWAVLLAVVGASHHVHPAGGPPLTY